MSSSDVLAQLSAAIAARAEAAKNAVAAVSLSESRHLSGLIWQDGIVVVSEQALPHKDEFELVLPGGKVVDAKVAGRDSSTNIAILKTADTLAAPAFAAAEAQ